MVYGASDKFRKPEGAVFVLAVLKQAIFESGVKQVRSLEVSLNENTPYKTNFTPFGAREVGLGKITVDEFSAQHCSNHFC